MTTQRPGRVTETPDDLVTPAVTGTAPLIVAGELRRLVATAGHAANQVDSAGGGDRR